LKPTGERQARPVTIGNTLDIRPAEPTIDDHTDALDRNAHDGILKISE
jgi:hypothetical protein